jgi:arylsulfatase A-like enzyme
MHTSNAQDSLPPKLVGRVFFLLSLSLAFFVSVALTARAAQAARPNIVLILADDLGYSDFGAYGSEVATPNVDAIASRGVVFSNYHTSPMCAPSRAMLMTGVSSHRAGVGNLPEFIPRSWTDKPGYLGHLAPDVVTIAQRLKPLGYDTYMTGKWHLGHEDLTLPSERGRLIYDCKPRWWLGGVCLE